MQRRFGHHQHGRNRGRQHQAYGDHAQRCRLPEPRAQPAHTGATHQRACDRARDVADADSLPHGLRRGTKAADGDDRRPRAKRSNAKVGHADADEHRRHRAGVAAKIRNQRGWLRLRGFGDGSCTGAKSDQQDQRGNYRPRHSHGQKCEAPRLHVLRGRRQQRTHTLAVFDQRTAERDAHPRAKDRGHGVDAVGQCAPLRRNDFRNQRVDDGRQGRLSNANPNRGKHQAVVAGHQPASRCSQRPQQHASRQHQSPPEAVGQPTQRNGGHSAEEG